MSEGGGTETVKHAETHQFALVKYTDMNEEMFTEIQEMVLGLIEKLSIDKASKEAAEQLQKKFGNGWNVIIGKAYGSAVTAVKEKFEI